MSARTATCREAPGPRGTNAARAPLAFISRPRAISSSLAPRSGERAGERGLHLADQLSPFSNGPRASPCSSASPSRRTPIARRTARHGHLPRCLAPGGRLPLRGLGRSPSSTTTSTGFKSTCPAPNNVRGGRALCWFRPEAREAISRAWQMAKLGRGRAGIPVRVYRKARPGTVVYEDDFQVAAVPWRMTFVR